jgi:hypothetical protein
MLYQPDYEPRNPAEGVQIIGQLEVIAESGLLNELRELDAGLYLRGNRLTRLTAGDLMNRLLAGQLPEPPLYKVAFITDNLFDGLHNEFFAMHVSLSGNTFDPRDLPAATNQVVVGYAVGQSAAYVGNKSQGRTRFLVDATMNAEQAANVLVQIV